MVETRKLFTGLRSVVCDAIGSTPLRVVCTHHKTGTSWLLKIFTEVGNDLNINLFDGEQAQLPDEVGIFFQDHSQICPSKLPYFKGVHLIRDPRDVVVSAMRYHQDSDEPWLHVPCEQFDGRTYQQALTQTPANERLRFEMQHSTKGPIWDMASWNYSQRPFMELKYEELVLDTNLELFAKMFRHIRFPKKKLDECLQIAYRNSLFSGQVDDPGHVYDGSPSQWPAYFSEDDKVFFKQQFGDVLIKLKYEKDMDW